jgi:hypothetical protein
LSVTPELASGGRRVYHVIATLRETGGAAATITAADLTLMAGSAAVASLHVDNPTSAAGNVCPANGTLDTRRLTITDDDASHPAATTVIARIAYTGGSTPSVTASADVPALAPPPTYAMSGLVSDDIGSRSVVGGTVQVVDSANAGRVATTDSSGHYSLPGLTAGSFSVRTSADGYQTLERSVTLSSDMRLDLRLRPLAPNPSPSPSPTPSPSPAPPTPTGCGYTLSPTSATTTWQGGPSTATITRTTGDCSWTASSDSSWLTLTGAGSGSGSTVLTYNVAVNGGIIAAGTRIGTVTVSWSGGSAQLRVEQGASNPTNCVFTLTVNGQTSLNAPASGGSYTANYAWQNTGASPAMCSGAIDIAGSWITTSTTTVPATIGSFTFNVAPNASGAPRAGSLGIRTSTNTVTVQVSQQQ